MRDTRHTKARAYPDLEAWVDYLDLEGKSTRTLYMYERSVAPLLRRHPRKTVEEFTRATTSTRSSA